MLTPEQLEKIPESLVRIFEAYEDFVIQDFVRRITSAKTITESARNQAEESALFGASMVKLNDALKEVLMLTQSELADLFKQWGFESFKFDTGVLEAAGFSAKKISELPSLSNYLKEAYVQTSGEFRNITQSLGFAEKVNGKTVFKSIASFYQDALDLAQLQVSSGVLDYNTAIKNAVKKITDSGLRRIDYVSGHSDHVDVAIRRATVTGFNQMAQNATDAIIEELGANYVETSAHAGARPDHAVWQGKVFSLVGSTKEYPNFYEVTKKGEGSGLGGWNCRHGYGLFFLGSSQRIYSDEALKNIDPKDFDYQGKTYTYYEATQRQRKIERAMRQTKRELLAADTAGYSDEFTAKSILLSQQRKEYKNFSSAANLVPQNERTGVEGYGRSISQKAVQAKRRSLTKTREI